VAAFLLLGGGDDGNPAIADATVVPTSGPQLPLAVLPPGPGAAATDVVGLLFISDRDGQEEIYVMNADGSNQTRLTSVAGGNRLPGRVE
jgi:hypothetical protein